MVLGVFPCKNNNYVALKFLGNAWLPAIKDLCEERLLVGDEPRAVRVNLTSDDSRLTSW